MPAKSCDLDNAKNEGRPEVFLKRLMLVCIAITAGISGIAIAGWMLDWLILTRINTDYIPMALSTALLFIVLSAALLVYICKPKSPHARMVAGAGVFLVLLISLIILIDFFSGGTLAIERLLINHPEKFDLVLIGRMSPITAANFILAGSALLLLLTFPAPGRQRAGGAAAFLATLVISVGFVVMLGYLYGAPLLYGGNIIPVALNTALVFVFLGFGLLVAAGAQYWPIRSFMGSSVSARLLRVFLPVTVALVLTREFLERIIFQNVGNYVLVSSMFTIVFLIILGIIIPKMSRAIDNDIDRANLEKETVHKLTIESLQASENNYRELLENLPQKIFHKEKNSVYVSCNNNYARDLKIQPGEIIGKTDYDFFTKELAEKYRADDIRIMESGKTEYIEEKYIHNGQEVTVQTVKTPLKDEKGNTNGILGIFWDNTKRKQTEEALKESEERHRNLVNSSPYGIAIHSGGKIKYINASGAKILGSANPDQFIGNKLLDLIHPDYHDVVRERVHMQEIGKTAPPIEEVFVRVDGTFVDVEITSIPFTYKGKLAMYGVFRDISERKKAEKMFLENERLAAADKAKSGFLATMSHELRTPLNAIIGFSDIMSLGIGGNLNEKQTDYVKDIHNAGEHLLFIINDILDLSKVEAGEMELIIEKFSVQELLEESITLIKNIAIKNHIDIIRDIDPQLEFIEGDKTRIKQVLSNLLCNAVKFSKEEGGTLTIEVKKEGDMAQISVSDTGIGIKEENVSKLFNKFEQVESGIARKYGGTGLGLAITKQIVKMHGGTIWAQSKYGEGSKFTFTLPIISCR